MAINLKKTNAVIIGVGAAGGVAALPLAQAGIEVIALEAGGWVIPRDMAPDELRYTRGWPAKLQKVNDEIPTHRATASSPMTPRPERHAMMNAVGGTSVHYWGQSWRLNPWDFRVVSETKRRYAASRLRLHGTDDNRREQDGPFSHNQTASVTALFPFNINTWYGTPSQGVAADDWADDNFDHSGLDFIGGGNLWVYHERRPIAAASMSTWNRAPLWGSAWKAFIKENADRQNTAYIQKTTLPYEENYLDLDPQVRDPLGFPVIRITAEYKENERKLALFMQDKMQQWYSAAGAIAIQRADIGPMTMSTHAYGGTRMGDNPETNVVDRWAFSHEAPNLGVLGASVMATSGARNPTLTAQALAWRTAEHLAKNWNAITAGSRRPSVL